MRLLLQLVIPIHALLNILRNNVFSVGRCYQGDFVHLFWFILLLLCLILVLLYFFHDGASLFAVVVNKK